MHRLDRRLFLRHTVLDQFDKENVFFFGVMKTIGIVTDEIDRIKDNIPRIAEQSTDIPEFSIPDQPMAGKQPLSKEAVTITAETVAKGAAADSLKEALEIGYDGFGRIACCDASREGISAFLEKRKPVFTGN
jgi:hypothetical protein